MNLEKYPVEVGETLMSYEFISEGEKGKITKLIIYNNTNLYNLYNLGFGDKNDATGEIDDTIITNNGDSQKVLATVAYTLYTFTDKFPEAMIFVTGSSKARTRLYKIGISNNYALIEPDFQVFGLTENKWFPFDKKDDYEAFLVIRKKK